jgi:hypothetical protein
MPCSMVSSEDVAPGLVAADQSGFGVWGRLAWSGEIGLRWSSVWSWFARPANVHEVTAAEPRHTKKVKKTLPERQRMLGSQFCEDVPS